MYPYLSAHLHQVANHQAFSASLGDLIAIATLALAWLTFRLDRASNNRAEVVAVAARLRGLRDGFFKAIGDHYFSTVYTPKATQRRAVGAAGRMDQVFLLPTEPIAVLVGDQRAVETGLISTETMVYGTIALWQVSKINDLVRKQATFNAVHAPDFLDASLGSDRKQAVLEASVQISAELHGSGIGDASTAWYQPLKRCVDEDLEALEVHSWPRAVRRNLSFLPLDLATVAAVVTVGVAYAHSI